MIKKNYFSKVLFLSYSQNKTLIILFASILILALLELIGIYLFIPLINKILSSNVTITSFQIEQKILNLDKNLLLFTIFIIFVFKSILNLFFLAIKSNAIKSLINNLSKELLRKYLKNNYEFFVNFSAATLIRNLNTEIPAFANRTLLTLLNLANDTILLLFILIFLLYFSFQNTLLIIFLFFVLASSFLLITRKKVLYWGKERIFPEKEKIKTAEEIFYGIREIKLYNLNNFFFNKFKKYNYRILSLLAKESILSQTPRIFFEICFIGIILSLIYFLLRVKTINEIILILGVFAVSFSRILPTISRIISSINSLRFSNATVNLLYNEFNSRRNDFNPTEIIENKDKLEFKNFIELQQICFGYASSKMQILKNINLVIKKNKIHGFFGASGQGKSTLLDIIIGLLKPSQGLIIIDGKKISNEYVISNSAYVSQNNFIINDTLRNNIILFKKNSEVHQDDQDYKINILLKRVNLFDKVQSLNHGLDTLIGEGGIALSGGEKQRLVLARALFCAPKLILLDEFTSALDKKNEDEVLEIIKEISKDTTVIISSHNKEIIDVCDFKFEVKKGNLVEVN